MSEPNSDSLLLRGDEVAALLQISRATAFAMMKRREIPVVQFGRSVRVPRDAFLRWLKERTEGGLQPTYAGPLS